MSYLKCYHIEPKCLIKPHSLKLWFHLESLLWQQYFIKRDSRKLWIFHVNYFFLIILVTQYNSFWFQCSCLYNYFKDSSGLYGKRYDTCLCKGILGILQGFSSPHNHSLNIISLSEIYKIQKNCLCFIIPDYFHDCFHIGWTSLMG